MAPRLADRAGRRRQRVLTLPTRDRTNGDDLTDLLDGDQRPTVPQMARLPARLASALRATSALALTTGEAIRGRRLRGQRRILLPQCELPLEVRNPLRLLRVLLPQAFILTSQAFQFFGLVRAFGDDRLGPLSLRRAPARCHASDGTPIAVRCTGPLNCYL
jgi:hypothetical protein